MATNLVVIDGVPYWTDEDTATHSPYVDENGQTQAIPIHEYPATVTNNDILRQVDGGEWELITTGAPLDATVLDHTPPLKGTVTYKARAWSDLPSSTDGAEATIEWVHDRCPIFVNGGPHFSLVCKARGNRTSDAFGIEQEKEHWAGNRLATGYWGEAEDYTFGFTANILGSASTRDEWREMLRQLGPVIYRDCQGRHIHGMLSVSTTGASGVEEVSFTIDELAPDDPDLTPQVVS